MDVDHVLLFDNLERDFNRFCAETGMDQRLRTLNRSTDEQKRMIGSFLEADSALQERVRNIYDADYQLYDEARSISESKARG